MPAIYLFLGVGVFLTFWTYCIQVRAFPRFLQLLFANKKAEDQNAKEQTINPFQALFAAMATTIGMGNIVGPSLAIVVGGPGALFWLVAYGLLAGVTKFTEVIFAVHFRKKLADGTMLGGPTQYLKAVTPFLGAWYGGITVFLLAGWSGLQANTLANVFYLEGVPCWITGTVLAIFAFSILIGGIKRIGALSSKLVPLMFILYISFSLLILFKNPIALWYAFKLMFHYAFTPAAAVGGFMGATLFGAIKAGVQRGIYITEAGLGTSSIAHAMADTKSPKDQATLALYSVIADMTLSLLSGLLVLVTGVWTKGVFSNTLMYEIFRDYSGFAVGKWVLIISITLFVITTIIGNSFNASQSFGSFTKNKGLIFFYLFLALVIFSGSLLTVPLIWKMMDVLVLMVAIPHLIGLLFLSIKYRTMIR